MQINNAANNISQTPIVLGNNSSVQALEQSTRVTARENLATEENKDQKSQADINSRQRLDIDEQSIALIEREQLPASNVNSNRQTNNQQSNNSSGYDAPPSQNQLAVAAYQSVGSIAQRDNIEQIFGVDLFA